MSMYGDYIKELLGDSILERDEGFITYRFLYENGIHSVYILDAYVRPCFRRSVTKGHSILFEMADDVVKIAKEKECRQIITTMTTSSKNPTGRMKLFIEYGLKIHSAVNDGIILKKEI